MSAQKRSTKKLIITIDGPAAAGKGTIAYLLARRFNLINIDSGACFRAIAWLAIQQGVVIDDKHIDQIVALVHKHKLEFIPMPTSSGQKSLVLIGGKDVTTEIRTEAISMAASILGGFISVRQEVLLLQRSLAKHSLNGVVVEGRDTGTMVFPNADAKFFLTASPSARADRRHAELVESGKRVSYSRIYSDIQERDKRDVDRSFSAMKIAEGSTVIDSTELTIDEVVSRMARIIERL